MGSKKAEAFSIHLHLHSLRPPLGRTDVAPCFSGDQTASIFLSRVGGIYGSPTWRWEAGKRPPPTAITSGMRMGPSPASRARASQPFNGADRVPSPLVKQQAPPIPLPAGKRRPPVPPALHLRKRGRSRPKDCASLRPLRHFIAPFPTSPTPRQPDQRQGAGKQALIGRR